MNKREKVLGIVVGAAVIGWFAIDVLGISGLFSGGGGSSLEAARTKYDSVVDKVANAPAVYQEFYALVGTETEVEKENEFGYAPDSALQSDIARWAASVGFPRPGYGVKVEDIRDPRDNKIIDDYQLVVMNISLPDGDLTRFARLLKIFESNGLIIQQVDFRASGSGERLSADITVARLVKFYKMTPARVRRS